MMMTRILAALGFVAVGAIGLAVVQSVWPSSSVADHANTLSSLDAPPPSAAPSASDGILRLSPEAVARAGIRVEAVGRGGIAQPLRMPATVEPDGYRTVEVTTLLPGTVLDMPVRLGDVIRAGTVVGRLRSPALTDEVRRWLTLRAERDVAASRLARTRRLAEIGAASRGDLEEDEAADVRAATDLTGAHARLVRLGLGEPRLAELVDGAPLPETFDVVAEAGGQVIARPVNPGQHVEAGQTLLTLADLSSVWVMGDVFEADLAVLSVGSVVRVTTGAFPERAWTGRLTYVEPEVARDTRTVKIRVEVPNPDRALRLGMLTSIEVAARSAPAVTVPRGAVQTLGTASVVYVETSAGEYTERVVRVGAESGGRVAVLDGLAAGESVVVDGSFALRSERERLGWAPPTPPAGLPVAEPETSAQAAVAVEPTVATRRIEITAAGLVPARVTVPAGQPVDLVFIRRVEETCGTDVVVPELGVTRDLPLDTPITIRLPAREPGEVAFTCGMGMLKGTIVVVR
jgi:RND family efflux transporter MFP subunit